MEQYVIKRGKIFQAGKYEDKNFEMSPEEVTKLVNTFKPVNLDLNHKTTISRLDSKLGKLAKITCDGKGQLFGEIHLPKWLDEVIAKDENGNSVPLGVSCTFHPTTKTLTKLAITDTPRVSDAAVFAAFSAAHPDEVVAETSPVEDEEVGLSVGEGQVFDSEVAARFLTIDDLSLGGLFDVQEIHDRASRSGAVCGLNEDVSETQRVHNASVVQGASCPQESGFSKELAQPVNKEEKRMSRKLDKSKILETLSTLLADEETTEMATQATETTPAPTASADTATPSVEASTTDGVVTNTTTSTPVAAELSAATGEEGEGGTSGFNLEDDPRYKQLMADLEQERLEKVSLLEESIRNQAKNFAADVIGRGVNIPANRVAIEAAFAQAIRDDQANAVAVTFSADGQSGSRVDALKALFNDLPSHDLTEEVLNPATTSVLLSSEQPKSGIVSDLEAVKQRAIMLADKLNKGQRGSLQ